MQAISRYCFIMNVVSLLHNPILKTVLKYSMTYINNV
jgi:hypothetical protein